jgi:hypothetical protein
MVSQAFLTLGALDMIEEVFSVADKTNRLEAEFDLLLPILSTRSTHENDVLFGLRPGGPEIL